MSKKPKQPTVPGLPAELLLSKEDLGDYLLQTIAHDIGPAVTSALLDSQLKSVLTGIDAAGASLKEEKKDPAVQRYEQLWDEVHAAAEALVEDHVLIFFTACQLYVRRVQEAVRWFKLHEGGNYKLKADYESETFIRGLGTKLVDNMTIADCMWHLGNYAKHRDELDGLGKATVAAMEKLGVVAQGQPQPDGYSHALTTMLQTPVTSPPGLKAALEELATQLRAWARDIQRTLIDDLDEYRYDGDRGRTRRDAEEFRRALKRQESGS